MLHRLLGVVGVSGLLIGAPLAAANAADMPLKAPPPLPPAVSWTGCYLSGGFGYGMLDDERYVTNAGGALTRPDSSSAAKGWLGTLGGGCDYQLSGSTPFGPVVVGAFADYDPMDISGSYGDPVNSSQAGTQKERDAWYAGARAGVLITPKLLTYIDGGWTGAHIDGITLSTFDSLPSQNLSGWFIGGGTEYAFTWLPINGLFLKTEYRFAEYDDYSQNYIHPTFRGTRSVVNNSVDTQTITTSLVWRFNWNGR